MDYRVAPDGGVRDVDASKRQALVTVPWEVLDTYHTDFARDAFTEFLTDRLPVACWQHQRAEPIGRAVSWQQGARAHEFVLQFDDFNAVPTAHRAFTQMESGTITDVSFGFDQAEAVPHPNGERGNVRFTKARMPEISPVTVGSIPGASVLGVRSEEAATIARLVDDQVISAVEAREMLRLAGPPPVRESITVAERATTITVADDGQVSVDGATSEPADDGADDSDPGMLAQAVDAAIDAAIDAYDAGNPEQGRALLGAADVTVDELLDALGVPDADEDAADGTERAAEAAHTTSATGQYADPGYQTDGKARYPLDTQAHVRAAWAFISQADNAGKYTAEQRVKVKANIAAAAKRLGVTVSTRSADDGLEYDVAAAVATATARGR